MRPILASLLLLAPLTLLTACPGSVEIDAEPGLLERTSFELPADGTPNENGFIGPFCCTGVTAIVETTAGYQAGYAYFYGWKGQAYGNTTKSFAPDVSIRVAGLADVHDAGSALIQGEIDFTADEMEVSAQKSSRAGQLEFTVTIEDVTLVSESGATYFDMGSLAMKLDVAVVH
jgi:hypothetical protein